MTERQKLKAMRGLRDYFEATVKVTGDHVLLVDVQRKGEVVVDHVWISERAMIRARLMPGDQIRFLATVKPYHKGFAQDTIVKSYTLREIAKIKVLK